MRGLLGLELLSSNHLRLRENRPGRTVYSRSGRVPLLYIDENVISHYDLNRVI